MFLKKIILKKNTLINQKLLNLNKLNSQIKLITKYEKLLEQKPNIKIKKKHSIRYIITIKFFKTGKSITASTISGETVIFNVFRSNFKKKVNIEELMIPLIKYCPFLVNKPVAIHLINISFNKKRIITKLAQYFSILVFKTFNTKPYNGCRLPRNSRKKRRTKRQKKKYFFINNNYLTKNLH